MGSSAIDQTGSRQFCSECGRPYASEDLVRFGAAAVCAECKPSYVQRMREGVETYSTAFVYGGFWRRFAAVVIDGILLEIVMIPIGMIMTAGQHVPVSDNPFGAIASMFLSSFWSLGTLLAYAVQFTYYVYFISQKGATLGKMLMGVKVVTPTGAPITVGRAAGRYFAQILSGLILCIGFIIAAFDSQKRALHDYICNTRVIRD